jgi:indole-3-glycerol phosphate synthase
MSRSTAPDGNILARILATKVKEVAAARAARPLSTLREKLRLASPVRDFCRALREQIAAAGAGVIA